MICPNCGTKLFLWIRLKGGGAFEYRVCCCQCEDMVAGGISIEEIAKKLGMRVQPELSEGLAPVTG